MIRNINIKKLRAITRAVQEKSFTKASMKENISQPALTNMIKEVEDIVGCNIFERSGATRKAVLTPRGEEIVQIFSKMINEYDHDMSRIMHLGNEKNSRKVVMVEQCFGASLNAKWFNDLIQRIDTDNLIIKMNCKEDIIDAVREKKAHLGIIDGMAPIDNLNYKPLDVCTISFCLLLQESRLDELPSKTNISWADLPKDTVIFSGINQNGLTHISKKLQQYGRNNHEFSEINSHVMTSKFAHELNYPVLVPEMIAKSLQKDLSLVSIDDSEVKITIASISHWGMRAPNIMNQDNPIFENANL